MKSDKSLISKIIACSIGYVFIIIIVLTFQSFTATENSGMLNTFYWLFLAAFLLFSFAIPPLVIISYINIKKIISSQNDGSLKDSLISKNSFKEIWDDYEKTFVKDSESLADKSLVGKTRANADLYFTSEEIINGSYLHFPILEFLKLVSGTFIGLGILGTFMGFSQFLENFIDGGVNLDSFEIFDGLKIAFNTSIIGLLSSIIYNIFIAHPILYLINKCVTELSDALDKEFFVSDEVCMRSLGNIVSITEESVKNNINKMVTDIKDVIIEGRNQFTEQVLGTADRLKEIDNSLENIPKNIQLMNNELNKSIDIAKEKTEAQLKLTLDAIDKKVNDVFGGFSNRFEESSSVIKSAVDSVKDFPKKLDSTIENASKKFNQNLNGLFDTTHKNLNNVFSDMNENIKEMLKNETASNIENTKQVLSDTESRLMMAADRMNKDFTLSVKNSKDAFEELINQSKTEINNFNDLMQESVKQNNQKVATSIASSIRQMDQMTKKLKAFTEQYSNIEKSLTEVSSKIVESEESFVNSSSEIKKLFENMAEIAFLMKDSQQIHNDMLAYLKKLPEQQDKMAKLFDTASYTMKDELIVFLNRAIELYDKNILDLTQNRPEVK